MILEFVEDSFPSLDDSEERINLGIFYAKRLSSKSGKEYYTYFNDQEEDKIRNFLLEKFPSTEFIGYYFTFKDQEDEDFFKLYTIGREFEI